MMKITGTLLTSERQQSWLGSCVFMPSTPKAVGAYKTHNTIDRQLAEGRGDPG